MRSVPISADTYKALINVDAPLIADNILQQEIANVITAELQEAIEQSDSTDSAGSDWPDNSPTGSDGGGLSLEQPRD